MAVKMCPFRDVFLAQPFISGPLRAKYNFSADKPESTARICSLGVQFSVVL